MAVRQGGDTPGDETAGGDSGEPRPGEPTEGREQGGQRSGAYVPGAEVLRGVQGGRQFGLLGTRGAGDQAAVVETGERGGGARIDQPGVQARVGGRRGGVVRDDAAAVRERTARIRAELAEILESQGGALVVGEGPGAGLRIGVRPGGFTRAGTAGHANRSEGFTRANTVGRGAPAMAFGTGQPDVREPGLIQAPGRARFGQGGLGRGFAGRGRVPDGFDPQRRAARMLTELDVIFAGSTPPGRRNTRSARHLLETKLEDYGFTVERGKSAPPP